MGIVFEAHHETWKTKNDNNKKQLKRMHQKQLKLWTGEAESTNCS